MNSSRSPQNEKYNLQAREKFVNHLPDEWVKIYKELIQLNSIKMNPTKYA